MIAGPTILLLFQLACEAIARAILPGLPGPVIGLVLLLAAAASARLAGAVRPVARGNLADPSLLFVPTGVGVTAHLGVLRDHGPALRAALAGSAVLAIAAGALAGIGMGVNAVLTAALAPLVIAMLSPGGPP